MSHDRRDDIDWEGLDRFIRGIANPAEREALERWVNGSAQRRALVDAMRTVGPDRAARFDAQRAVRRFRRAIEPV